MPVMLSLETRSGNPIANACQEIDLYEAILLAIVRGDLAFQMPDAQIKAELKQVWNDDFRVSE